MGFTLEDIEELVSAELARAGSLVNVVDSKTKSSVGVFTYSTVPAERETVHVPDTHHYTPPSNYARVREVIRFPRIAGRTRDLDATVFVDFKK